MGHPQAKEHSEREKAQSAPAKIYVEAKRSILRRTGVWGFRILLFLIVTAIGARIALPTILEHYVNRQINRIPEYAGSVGDIDVWLIRGAYTIRDIKLTKKAGKVPVPLFSADVVDLSVQWRALLEGKWVGAIEIDHGVLNFVNAESKKDSQTRVSDEWLSVVKDLFPLRINHFEMKNSEVHYRDFSTEPKIDVIADQLEVVGTNFSNTRTPSIKAPAEIRATGKVEKVSALEISSHVFPGASKPTFDAALSVKNMPLKRLNDFFKGYGNFEVEDGTIALYADFAAGNNKFRGSVRPLIKDIKIADSKAQEGPLHRVWAGLVSAISGILENSHSDRIATTIPFSGTLDDPKTSLWDTVLGLLENAFIRSLKPGFDNSINVENLFGGSEKKTE